MPFLGKTPAQGFVNSVTKDDFTPNGTTTAFAMSKAPATANEIEVYVGNVRQEPTDAYSVSGTTLTMTEAPATNTNFYVMHIGGTTQSSTVVGDGTVTSAKIVSGAVTSSKLDANIAISGTTTSTGLITASAGVAIGGTGSANTLDDYEEGTWTPTLLGASSNPTVGYVVQTGHYTKTGNAVNLYCRLQTNSRSGGSGTALIGGLPFAHNSARAGGGLGYLSGVNLSSGYSFVGLSGDPVSSTIRYVQSGDNVGSNIINVTEVAASSNHDIVFTYTYQTNS